MTPAEMLDRLAELGVNARLAEPGQIMVSPLERIPGDLLPELKAAKPDLCKLIEARIAERAQAAADAFEGLAVKYHSLPVPRCSTAPREAAELEALIATSVSYAAPEPFEEALAAFVAVVEGHFAHHLLDVCQTAGIELEAVKAEDGEAVLRARPAEGHPVPAGLGRALRVLRAPVIAQLPPAGQATHRRAHR